LKTLRKKNASVVFATQSLSDIDISGIAPAIIESCQTRLLLPNERAIEPQITGDLSTLWTQRPADRDSRARHAEARLLLQVATRHRLFELGTWRGSALASARALQTGSGHDRRRCSPSMAVTVSRTAWLHLRGAAGRRSRSAGR